MEEVKAIKGRKVEKMVSSDFLYDDNSNLEMQSNHNKVVINATSYWPSNKGCQSTQL